MEEGAGNPARAAVYPAPGALPKMIRKAISQSLDSVDDLGLIPETRKARRWMRSRTSSARSTDACRTAPARVLPTECPVPGGAAAARASLARARPRRCPAAPGSTDRARLVPLQPAQRR